MKELGDIFRFWEARPGQRLVLATLVATHGSSFRLRGARMIIHANGDHVGSLTAGCIEEEVICHAREVLQTGEPRLLAFDTRLRFGCNGSIEIFVEPVRDHVLAELRDTLLQRKRCLLATIYTGEGQGTRIADYVTVDGCFTQTIQPAIRLVLIGDGAEIFSLRTQSRLLGWDATQIEVEEIGSEVIDDRTAVVLATHNYGRDCAALRELLPMQLAYLGLVGSRRRRDDLLFDVLQDGLVVVASLYAPAGLHLGADSPDEIALSIAAEIQSVFAAGSAQNLRAMRKPIHHREPEASACPTSAD